MIMVGECQAEGGACNEVKRIKEEVQSLKAQAQTNRDDIRSLFAAQEGTKAYVTQILARIDGLETKLFTWVQELMKNQAEERQAEINAEIKKAKLSSQERATAQKTWIDYGKYVIAMTFAALITYIFTTGGPK